MSDNDGILFMFRESGFIRGFVVGHDVIVFRKASKISRDFSRDISCRFGDISRVNLIGEVILLELYRIELG